MSVGVMKDQKRKLRDLRASHTLGCLLLIDKTRTKNKTYDCLLRINKARAKDKTWNLKKTGCLL